MKFLQVSQYVVFAAQFIFVVELPFIGFYVAKAARKFARGF